MRLIGLSLMSKLLLAPFHKVRLKCGSQCLNSSLEIFFKQARNRSTIGHDEDSASLGDPQSPTTSTRTSLSRSSPRCGARAWCPPPAAASARLSAGRGSSAPSECAPHISIKTSKQPDPSKMICIISRIKHLSHSFEVN